MVLKSRKGRRTQRRAKVRDSKDEDEYYYIRHTATIHTIGSGCYQKPNQRYSKLQLRFTSSSDFRLRALSGAKLSHIYISWPFIICRK